MLGLLAEEDVLKSAEEEEERGEEELVDSDLVRENASMTLSSLLLTKECEAYPGLREGEEKRAEATAAVREEERAVLVPPHNTWEREDQESIVIMPGVDSSSTAVGARRGRRREGIMRRGRVRRRYCRIRNSLL